MAVVRNGDYWFFEWKLQGKKVRRSSGLKVSEAKREDVRELEDDAKRTALESLLSTGDSSTSQLQLTLEEAIERYYNEKWSRDRSGEKQRKNALVAAGIIGRRKQLSDITARDLINVKSTLFERKKSGSTVNRHISAITTILNHACRYWEILDKVPAVKREDESQNIRLRVVTWEEEKKILEACETLGELAFRDFYIVLVDTGLRKEEGRNLSYASHIDFPHGTITIHAREHKNKRTKTIPMSKRVREVLTRRKDLGNYPFATGLTEDAPLKRLQKVLKAAGLQPVGDIVIHSLRHTFAARLANAKVPIYEVSKLLGHTSVKTTERNYGHLFVDTLRTSISVLDEAIANRGE